MIDTHIHLESEEYNADCQEVIKRFFENGGRAIVNVGVDEERMKEAMEIAKLDERIFVAVGFHPQEGTDLFRARRKVDFERILEGFAKNPKVVAIGEIGLDYFHPSAINFELKIDDEIKEIQKKLFTRQLDLAKKLNLPVIIHSWDAHNDCWEILKNYSSLKIVFHCYGRGIDPNFTKKLLEHENIFFSFTSNVTFDSFEKYEEGMLSEERGYIFKNLQLIPLEKIMVETDGPFLAPVPYRGKRNEPRYVRYVIEKIAKVKGLDIQRVEDQTDENAVNFFKIKTPIK